MTDRQLQAIVTGIITAVQKQLGEELAPLETRMVALEARTPRDGRDGRDADPTQFLALQAKVERLEAALAAVTRERRARAATKGGDDDEWMSSLPIT